jgi:hypothetical protein
MFTIMNQSKIKYLTGRRQQAGATLLVIIIAMSIIAVLGVAIYTLTSTARLSQAVAHREAKAFYLSESGIRIAASEYKAAVAANSVYTKLPALHAKVFNMPNNGGKVQLEVYPYWFYAKSNFATGATTITLYLPGAAPNIDDTGTTAVSFPENSDNLYLLRIRDVGRSVVWEGNTNTTTFVYFNKATVGTFDAVSGGTPVAFTLSAAFPAPNQVLAGDEFYIGSNSFATAQEANQGGTLILNIPPTDAGDNTAKMFPPSKGTMFIVKSDAGVPQYTYDLRIITTTSSPHTVKFTNMQPLANAVWPLNVSPGHQIFIGKTVGFRSTATYGE